VQVSAGPRAHSLALFPAYALLVCLALVVVGVDQAVKALVAATLKDGRVVDLLGGAIRFDYTSNTGAAFGVFRAGGILFALVAALVSAGIILYYRRIAASPLMVRVGLGLILGGALGNLIDRMRLGYVIDFIDLRWWPVFNLADSAIVIGVCMLAAFTLLQPGADGEPGSTA
jgi:signal peptidase II